MLATTPDTAKLRWRAILSVLYWILRLVVFTRFPENRNCLMKLYMLVESSGTVSRQLYRQKRVYIALRGRWGTVGLGAQWTRGTVGLGAQSSFLICSKSWKRWTLKFPWWFSLIPAVVLKWTFPWQEAVVVTTYRASCVIVTQK